MPPYAMTTPRACQPTGRHRVYLGPHPAPTAPGPDALLVLLLVSTWELRTGRPAPRRSLTDMTEAELIEFWSDPREDPCPPHCPAPHPAR